MHQVSITIDVSNLTKAINFYTLALSCELKKKHSADWAVLTIGGVDINLIEKDEGSVAAAQHKRSYERHWTPVHMDFNVGDVQTSIEQVKLQGGLVEGHISTENSEFAHCADPFGNGFCLISN